VALHEERSAEGVAQMLTRIDAAVQLLRYRVSAILSYRAEAIERAEIKAFVQTSSDDPQECISAARVQLEALAQRNQLSESLAVGEGAIDYFD